MERKPALVTGIAVAGVAAVFAATPAIFSPPSMQEVRVTASAPAPLLKKQVTVTDIQLAAFTLQGLVSAYMDGYFDQTYFQGDIDSALEAYKTANPSATAAQITAKRLSLELSYEANNTVGSEAGAIYYVLDQLLPAGINIDDDYFLYDVPGVYLGLLTSVGIPEEFAGAVVQFITDPFGLTFDFAEGVLGLPPVIRDLINDPIITVFAIARDLASGKIPDSFFGDGLLQELTAPSDTTPSGITSLTSGADTFTVNTVSGAEAPEVTASEPEAKLAEPEAKLAEPEAKLAEPEVNLPEVKLPKFDFDVEKLTGPKAIAGFLKDQEKQEAEKDSSSDVPVGAAGGAADDSTSGGAADDSTSGGAADDSTPGGAADDSASGGGEGGSASGGGEGGNASGGGE